MVEKVATLEELETVYSLDDALKLLAMLNLKQDMEELAMKEIKHK